MYGANVIIFEGILAFHNEDIRNLLDMKVAIFSVSALHHEPS
jgi:uridine kinase